VLAPLVALGAMPLTFYVLHFVYLGTVWAWLQPRLSSPVAYLVASLTFWLVFAMIAGRWLDRFRRGPFEMVLHATAVGLTSPWRIGRGASTGDRRVLQRVTPHA